MERSALNIRSSGKKEITVYPSEDQAKIFDKVYALLEQTGSDEVVKVARIGEQSVGGQRKPSRSSVAASTLAAEDWETEIKADMHSTSGSEDGNSGILDAIFSHASSEPEATSPSDPNTADIPDMSDESDVTREELDAKLGEYESEVRRMTQEAITKFDRIEDKQDSIREEVRHVRREAKDDTRSVRSSIWAMASIIAVLFIGGFTALLQQFSSVRDRIFGNARRIAQISSDAISSDSLASSPVNAATATDVDTGFLNLLGPFLRSLVIGILAIWIVLSVLVGTAALANGRSFWLWTVRTVTGPISAVRELMALVLEKNGSSEAPESEN